MRDMISNFSLVILKHGEHFSKRFLHVGFSFPAGNEKQTRAEIEAEQGVLNMRTIWTEFSTGWFPMSKLSGFHT